MRPVDPSERPAARPGEWRLRQAGGREIVLQVEEGKPTIVGRDLSCGVTILDAGVSRHHAALTLEGEDLWLEDLHSQNGTFVNTERVFRARVHTGDVLTFGRVSITAIARPREEDIDDPVAHLAPHTLSRLVRLARRFGEAGGGDGGLDRLLVLTLEALGGGRGAVLAPGSDGVRLEALTASPTELRDVVQGLPAESLGPSSGELTRTRLLDTSPLREGVGALVAPVRAGNETLAIICVDRGAGGQPFQPADAALLDAFLWILGWPLSLLRQSGRRGLAERDLLAPRGTLADLALRGSRAHGKSQPWSEAEELEAAMTRTVTALEQQTAQAAATSSREAVRALHLLRLALGALRVLRGGFLQRLEPVTWHTVSSEVAGLDAGRRTYQIAGDGETTFACCAEGLVLAMRLLSELLRLPSAAVVQLAVEQNSLEGKATVHLRSPARADATGAQGSPALAPLERQAELLAERLVLERLDGELTAPAEGAFEVRLPLAATVLAATIDLRGAPRTR